MTSRSSANHTPTTAVGGENPREHFRSQLTQLTEMGFTDEAANLIGMYPTRGDEVVSQPFFSLSALTRSRGDVQGAIQFLLG